VTGVLDVSGTGFRPCGEDLETVNFIVPGMLGAGIEE